MTVYYIITHNCNLSCPHCIRGASNNNNMNTQSAIASLNKLFDDYPDATIILSGGEPTLHPDFDIILQEASKLFRCVVINSNGTTNYYRTSDSWEQNNIIVQFSIDGDENTHNEIRGKGNFEKVIQNIEFINQNNKQIWISTTVSKNNYDSIKKLPAILCKYRIGKWQIAPMMPFGNASRSDIISIDEWNELVDELIEITPFRLGVRKLFDIQKLISLTNSDIQRIAENSRNIDFRNCGCLRSKVYVYPNMNVYPCTCLTDMPLGRLSKDTLKSILEKANQSCKICSFEKCRKCRYFPICNGGCWGMQKKYGADIRCPLIGELTGV